MKQITYVILNDDSEIYAGVTDSHILWTKLIIHATLFDNKYFADKTNKDYKLKGTVKRMRYTLENC